MICNGLRYPKYTRQKFLLSFLQCAPAGITKLDIQKLLFLFQQYSKTDYFHFIPYLYGCYSFQANSDVEVLEKQGWLQIDKNLININRADMLTTDYTRSMRMFFSTLQHTKGIDLVKQVYRSSPYYAINSRLAHKILDDSEIEEIERVQKKYQSTKTALFTIGYEGSSLEEYINMLIRNDIKVLCDVRNNPLSRKFGFSKSMLSAVLPKINVIYDHIPQLGIVSSKRQLLSDNSDYKILFNEYRKSLPEKNSYIEYIVSLLQKHQRVALTCFEKDPLFCHRHVLGQFIKDNYPFELVDL